MFCFSCSSTKAELADDETTDTDIAIKEETTEENKSLFIENAEPFYPIKETVEDIQDQVNELRSRMIDYEERIASPNLNYNISISHDKDYAIAFALIEK